jgi:hypothetical protein
MQCEINIESLSGKKTVSRDDGKIIYDEIKQRWQDCEQITVDFADLLIASVSFVDEAFGQLALEFSESELRSKLKFVNMNEYDRALLNDIILSRVRQRQHQAVAKRRRGPSVKVGPKQKRTARK